MSGPQAWTAPGSPLPSQQPPPGSPDEAPILPGAGASPPADAPERDPVATMDRADLLGGDIPFRPLGVSEILDASIGCIRRHPRAVLGLSLAITSVIQVLISLGGYLLFGDQEELSTEPLTQSVGAQFTLSLLGLAMSAYGTLLMAGLLGPVVSRTLFDQPASLRQAWRDARPAVGRLLVTAALVLVTSLVAGALPLVPFLMLLAVDGPPAAGVLAAVIGFPVALGVTIWLYMLWVLAVPVLVLERQTVWDAMRRAIQLSRARWWRTCGTLLLALIITIFMGFLALRLPFLFLQLILFGDGSDGGQGALLGALAVDTLGRIVSWSLITPFNAGVIALLYIDRRMRREGFDLDLQTRGRDDDSADPLDVWRPVEFPATNYPPPGPARPIVPYFPPPQPSAFPGQPMPPAQAPTTGFPVPPQTGPYPRPGFQQPPSFPPQPGPPAGQPYPGVQPPPHVPPQPSTQPHPGAQPQSGAYPVPGVQPQPGAYTPPNAQPMPGTSVPDGPAAGERPGTDDGPGGSEAERGRDDA